MIKSIVEHLLAWAARRVLAAQQPVIVGVTGSAAKTSTKEAIGSVLVATLRNRRVRVAAGNLNSEFGLPLAILGITKPEHKSEWAIASLQALWKGMLPGTAPSTPSVLVLEYGVEYPGDMKRLLQVARPTIAVVTNVGSAHTEFLGSLAGVAREKGALVEALLPSGLAILNQSDVRVRAFAKRTAAKVVLVRAKDSSLVGALAIAVAVHGFGVSESQAKRALQRWQAPLGRMNLLDGTKGTKLIDDSYNANPISMAYALGELGRLATQQKAKRRIVILGDMLELGTEEHQAHQAIAEQADREADLVLLVGPRFRRTNIGTWFPGPLPAAAAAITLVQKGDLILIKGSQSMRMEKVTEALLAKPNLAGRVLVRQTPVWRKKPYVTP